MKNISNLFLWWSLLLSSYKKHIQRKTCDLPGLWVFSKQDSKWHTSGYDSHELCPHQQAGGWGGVVSSALGGLRGGGWRACSMSQHSTARSRSHRLQPSSFGGSVVQTWPYANGIARETSAHSVSRWDSCVVGSPMRNLSEGDSQTWAEER